MRRFALRSVAPWIALLTLTAAGAAAAAGYALTAPDRYRATAQLIVTPVPADDATYTGIDVLREGSGRRTAAASAAALVRGPLVADAVRALLGLQRSRDDLLSAVEVHVVDASNVVAVTAEDTSANGAAQLANAFADTVVNQRTASFDSEVAAAVRRYSQLLGRMTIAERSGAAGVDMARRLAALRALQGQPDPTLKHAGQATAPTSASGPDVARLVGVGALVGAAAGLLVALALVAFRRAHLDEVPLADLPSSERGLEAVVDRLARRESGLAARERDLRAAIEELKQVQAAAESQAAREEEALAKREHDLEERIGVATRRELELARRAADVSARERELEQAPPPAPPQPLPVADAGPGRHNVEALEAAVDERGGAFPERLDEWRSYLYFLRAYADAGGALPASFDALVEDAFADLLR